MSAPSRFSPQDWEATLVACHYHPEHIKELMKLRDDMHDYEMHVHRLATDPNHKVPDPPNVTMRMGQILGDSVAQFSQSRETSFHDGKRPGEFAPSQGGKVALPLEPFPKSFQELQSRDYVDVFHGTTIQRLEKMLARGGSRKGDRGQFLITPDFTHASQYPEFPGDDEDPVVIAVRVPVSSLRPDENDNPGISLEDSLFTSPYTSAADVHGGITFDQIRGVFGDSPEDAFTADETGPEIAAAIMNKSHQFSRDESPLDLACRLSGVDPADVVESLPSEFSRQLDEIGPVEFGQQTFNWDEAKVHRETTSHDGKKPGEFAPKHEGSYPSINAVKDEYKFPERLNKLTAILDAHRDGDVPKAQFEMAKSHLNWIKDAKRHLLNWMHADRDGETDAEHPKMSPEEREAVREAYYGFNKKSIKALEKLKSEHPAVKFALTLNAELEKLGSQIESMKGRVVTAAQQREAKKEAAVRAEKAKPVTALSKVVAEATETLRPQMKSFFKRVMTDRLSLLNRMVDEYNSQEIPESPGIRLTKEYRDAMESRSRKWKSIQALFSELRNCLNADASVMEGNHKFDDARLEGQSNSYATGVIEGMRSKINQKLEDLDDASFKHASGGENTFGLHGTRDGKKVEIQQSVKWNVSSLGTPFNQYPALIYVDGKSVSEAKYKSMFSKKTEQPSSEPEKPKGSAQSFISTVREMGYKNPFSNETVVGNAAVELHASPDGSVWLKSIRALTPQKGDGSAMLKQLTKLADEHGVEIKGEAVPFGKSMSASKLKKWYVSHGFMMNGEEFTYTPTPRLKIGSGAMRSIPIEQPEQE